MKEKFVVDERNFKEKTKDWTDRQKEKVSNGWNWIQNNRDQLVWIVPAAVATVSSTAKVISSAVRHHAVNKEIRFHERTIYDRSLGRYVELRRPLSNTEALLIEERRRNGEGLTAILDSMKLLKHR